MEKCNHKIVKENFPFGKKSTSTKICKDCCSVVTNKMIMDRRKNRK
jgi:hypothetical protein